MLTSIVARARVVELLEFLIIEGESTAAIGNLDIAIPELRELLSLAATKALAVTREIPAIESPYQF